MQHPLTARRQAKPNGVIETLTAGYATVNRRFWVLLLPFVLDLGLWLGPHVSFSPIIDPVVTNATEVARQVGSGPRRPQVVAQEADAAAVQDVDSVRQWLIARTHETNALTLLARGPLGVPSVAVMLGATGGLAFVGSWTEGLGLLLLCLAAGLLLGGWFYAGLAGGVREPHDGPLTAGKLAPRGVARVLGLLALAFGVGLLLGVPVLILVGFTALVAPAAATLGLILVLIGLILVEIYLFFAVAAIFVSGVGPLRAVQRSVTVVRSNLRASIGLILLTWLILAGMSVVWEMLANALQAPFGVLAGMLGNAYVASGLIAAGMVFYKERVEVAAASNTPVAAPPT